MSEGATLELSSTDKPMFAEAGWVYARIDQDGQALLALFVEMPATGAYLTRPRRGGSPRGWSRTRTGQTTGTRPADPARPSGPAHER